MYFDLDEAELYRYESTQVNPGDFEEFWTASLLEARRLGPNSKIEKVESPLRAIDVYSITFNGFDGNRVSGWLRVPAGQLEGLPCLSEFVGYGGGRGLAEESLFWASCGYAHLVMDTRGQGASWSQGTTADAGWSGPHIPGFATKGIESRETYYYRRLFVDAAMALDAAIEVVRPERLVAYGVSQGGGVAIAASTLSGKSDFLVANVPFLSDFPRAITLTDVDPYNEIARYLRTYPDRDARVLELLQYFDAVNFARRAKVPALFSAGLMDTTCPPSTVFGAFNAYTAQKKIRVRRFGVHAHGIADDLEIHRWLETQ